MFIQRNVKKKRLELSSNKTVKQMFGILDSNTEVFGMTSGQFSKIDMFSEIVNQMKPCDCLIGSWNCGVDDAVILGNLIKNGSVKSIFFVTDTSYFRREQKKNLPALIDAVGIENLSFCEFHAKFMTFKNDDFCLSCLTSANMNMNRRVENFQLTADPEIYKMLSDFVDVCREIPLKQIAGFGEYRHSRQILKFANEEKEKLSTKKDPDFFDLDLDLDFDFADVSDFVLD